MADTVTTNPLQERMTEIKKTILASDYVKLLDTWDVNKLQSSTDNSRYFSLEFRSKLASTQVSLYVNGSRSDSVLDENGNEHASGEVIFTMGTSSFNGARMEDAGNKLAFYTEMHEFFTRLHLAYAGKLTWMSRTAAQIEEDRVKHEEEVRLLKIETTKDAAIRAVKSAMRVGSSRNVPLALLVGVPTGKSNVRIDGKEYELRVWDSSARVERLK